MMSRYCEVSWMNAWIECRKKCCCWPLCDPQAMRGILRRSFKDEMSEVTFDRSRR
jgi:hypothetical protein